MVTGFEPFGGDEENPTAELIWDLEKREKDYDVVPFLLPVSARRIRGELEKILRREEPDVCVHFGLAPGYSNISVERVAINILDARIPDNDGFQPKDVKIVEGGPLAYFSTLPTRRIYEQMTSEGIPCRLSYSAGTYLCNMLMYLSLHYSENWKTPRISGFIHVPYLPRQVVKRNYTIGRAVPSMCYEMMLRGAEIAVDLSVRKLKENWKDDLSFS